MYSFKKIVDPSKLGDDGFLPNATFARYDGFGYSVRDTPRITISYENHDGRKYQPSIWAEYDRENNLTGFSIHPSSFDSMLHAECQLYLAEMSNALAAVSALEKLFGVNADKKTDSPEWSEQCERAVHVLTLLERSAELQGVKADLEVAIIVMQLDLARGRTRADFYDSPPRLTDRDERYYDRTEWENPHLISENHLRINELSKRLQAFENAVEDGNLL